MKFESKKIKDLLFEYNNQKNYWNTFFNTYNIKIFLSWYKYTRHHIVMNQCINENGGVSAIWQMAFDGSSNLQNKTFADIVFSYSNFSTNLDEENKSNIKHNIITGYPKDYTLDIIKKKNQSEAKAN